jgi:hypothetical protein
MSETEKPTVKLPDLLSYPEIKKFDDMPEMHDQFVYIIKSYPTKGLTVLIYRKDAMVHLKFGDFSGKIIEPHGNKSIKLFLEKYCSKLVELMSLIKIPQALHYFVVEKNTLRLVDVRTSLNKFIGPGMLRDLYGKIIDTQEVVKTIQLNSETIEGIKADKGSYKGGLILKTSAFKTVTRGTSPKLNMYPMYAKVR